MASIPNIFLMREMLLKGVEQQLGISHTRFFLVFFRKTDLQKSGHLSLHLLGN